MRFCVNSSVIVSMVFCSVLTFAQDKQYTYGDVYGIWVYETTQTRTDCEQAYGNEFLIFNSGSFIFIPTHNLDCTAWNDFKIYQYGFTDECLEKYIDSLYDNGRFLSFGDDGEVWSWCNFYVDNESMYFFNSEYMRIVGLPKKAQIVLYENSQKDHRNYAREFLDYDICGVKAEDCQMLDSLQHPIGIAIAKDDIVVVRDTSGEMLKVEYEDVPEHVVYGYIKRKDLIFVDEESNTPIVE